MNQKIQNKKYHVVVIGAGFGGLRAARTLAKKSFIELTAIDKANHHLFQPLLYQVATAGLSPADISAPIRRLIHHQQNTEVLMAAVENIDPDAKKIHLDDGDVIAYDYLILATGAQHSYFNHPEWEQLAPGLKTIEDATEIRRRVLLAFEQAEKAKDSGLRRAYLTFIIVGGGPTGVELAGAIAELSTFTLAKDFHHINPTLARIILVEAGPRILRDFPEPLAQKALISLKKLGITVLVNSKVINVTQEGVQLEGEFLIAKTIIWAAGVKPSGLANQVSQHITPLGKVIVNPDLRTKEHDNIFVIGDLANVKIDDIKSVPAVAPAAIQQGVCAANNIINLIKNKPTQPFKYHDKGNLATIGRKAAIADLGFMRFSGYLAWWIWLVVHILYLISFRNKVFVLLQWAWSYLTYQRGARLITGSGKRQ